MTDQVPLNDRRARYEAAAGQDEYDIDFPLETLSDESPYTPEDLVNVYINGAADPLDTDDYTVNLETLKVTLDPSISADIEEGDIVTLEGNSPRQRTNGYPLRGGLSSALLNSDINKIFRILQEMTRDVGRALILNRAEDSDVSPSLPLKDEGKIIMWGATGLQNGPGTTDLAAVAQHLEEIDQLAAIDEEMVSLESIKAKLEALYAIIGDIEGVYDIRTSVPTVAANEANINAAVANEVNINTAASNIGAIIAAPTEAANAASSASIALAAQVAAQAAAASVANEYVFDTSTSMADPGSTKIRFNNATLGSVTSIAISANSGDGGSPDISSYIVTWDDSNHTPAGLIRMESPAGDMLVFGVAGAITDHGAWLEIPVSVVMASGALSASEHLFLTFSGYGNDGTGSLNASGTPSAGQVGIWVTGSTVKGVTVSGDATMDSSGVLTVKSSIALAGSPTTTSQAQRDGSTKVATDEYVDREASMVPVNSQSVDYTAVLSDAGKCLYQTGASKTFTIPPNGGGGAVAYPVGTVLMFECANASGVTIAITTDTLNSTLGSGSRTLAQYGQAFAHKVTSTSWIINGSGLS